MPEEVASEAKLLLEVLFALITPAFLSLGQSWVIPVCSKVSWAK